MDNFDLWFKEAIPNSSTNEAAAADTNEDDADILEDVMDVAEVVVPEVGFIKKTAKKVRGFVERLQSSNDTGVHTNKLPSTKEDEAMLHMDLCLDYMEIVDKALVDEVPKIFIMMLVMRTIDFLNGGKEQ